MRLLGPVLAVALVLLAGCGSTASTSTTSEPSPTAVAGRSCRFADNDPVFAVDGCPDHLLELGSTAPEATAPYPANGTGIHVSTVAAATTPSGTLEATATWPDGTTTSWPLGFAFGQNTRVEGSAQTSVEEQTTWSNAILVLCGAKEVRFTWEETGAVAPSVHRAKVYVSTDLDGARSAGRATCESGWFPAPLE